MSEKAKPTPRELVAAHRLGEAIMEMIVASQEGLLQRHPQDAPQIPIVHVECSKVPQSATEPSHPPMKRLLTMREAAKYLSISDRTLWGLANRREIVPTRIGRRVHFSIDELDAAIVRMQKARR